MNAAEAMKATVLRQLDQILEEAREVLATSEASPANEALATRLITRALAAVERIAGKKSVHLRQATEFAVKDTWGYRPSARLVASVVEALRADVEGGFIATLAEQIHGDLFADFLEMAQHLCDENYKDAAAVIAGSSLEAHLRQLCEKHQIGTTHPNGNPKKADALNSELAAAGAYNKGDQKSVVAWLGLRNDAAHGHYGKYEVQQVQIMIASVRDFVTRVPA
jgi:hypothetical protein